MPKSKKQQRKASHHLQINLEHTEKSMAIKQCTDVKGIVNSENIVMPLDSHGQITNTNLAMTSNEISWSTTQYIKNRNTVFIHFWREIVDNLADSKVSAIKFALAFPEFMTCADVHWHASLKDRKAQVVRELLGKCSLEYTLQLINHPRNEYLWYCVQRYPDHPSHSFNALLHRFVTFEWDDAKVLEQVKQEIEEKVDVQLLQRWQPKYDSKYSADQFVAIFLVKIAFLRNGHPENCPCSVAVHFKLLDLVYKYNYSWSAATQLLIGLISLHVGKQMAFEDFLESAIKSIEEMR